MLAVARRRERRRWGYPKRKAEKAAGRLLQKLKGVPIEREKFIEYRKIISNVTITEGLISKDDDGDADDAADDGLCGDRHLEDPHFDADG
jgi:hypothetical protein